MIRTFSFFSSLLFLLSLPSVVLAAAVFSAEGESSFTLNSDGEMDVSIVGIEMMPTPPTTTGTGMVTTNAGSNSASLGLFAVGTSLDLMAEVAGSAASPPSSSAMALVLTGNRIRLDNTAGATDAIATFTFTYDGTSSVSADPDEQAVAGPFFHITGIADVGPGETMRIDTGTGFMAADEFLVDLVQNTADGDTGLSEMGTVEVEITIAAGATHEFSVITDARGFAISPVPEPASVISWSIFATAVVIVRRLRRARC